MNHYAVDVLGHRLQQALYGATVVTDVTSPSKFEVRSAGYFSNGDAIVVTRLPGGTTHNTTISSLPGNVLTVSPAVSGIQAGDEVQLRTAMVDHAFYHYNAIDPATGEPPSMERPLIAVALPHQVPQLQQAKANTWQQPAIDKTRAAIYIEGRMAVDSGGTRTGGMTIDMLPAIEIVRSFIHDNPALVIPVALSASFRSGKVGMVADQPPEAYYRLKGFERHVFFVALTFMTTTA